MWGGISVCALRIARKFNFDNLKTALVGGFLVVTMDLLLDVVAIRLNGGFWVWDGRPITLDINHHMFMSVICWYALKSYPSEDGKSVICKVIPDNKFTGGVPQNLFGRMIAMIFDCHGTSSAVYFNHKN